MPKMSVQVYLSWYSWLFVFRINGPGIIIVYIGSYQRIFSNHAPEIKQYACQHTDRLAGAPGETNNTF